MSIILKGGTLVTPLEVLPNRNLSLKGEKIESLTAKIKQSDTVIELDTNDLIFPGLINSHDHLLGNYFPRVGSGPYLNWRPWDNDLKSAPIYQERGHITNEDLYQLASFRNIVSGVTTVQDHIPHIVNENFIDQLPVGVIKKYSLGHECSSYDLKWGAGITPEHQKAIKENIPFITHLEEGFDEEATKGIDILNELKALDEYTVLVHGIAFSEDDIRLIKEKQSHVVWCPYSNYFMFKETTNIRSLLKNGVNVALGTDSPMSGSLNILEEMKFAHSLYQELYHEDLDFKEIVKMVTVNAAKALRLPDIGEIAPGKQADLTIIQGGNPKKPYQSLVESEFNSIKLVIREGKPLYGNLNFKSWFTSSHANFQETRINGEDRLLVQKPNDLYQRIWNAVTYKKILPFLPIDSDIA